MPMHAKLILQGGFIAIATKPPVIFPASPILTPRRLLSLVK
jgi:hypothetical protein